jgi:hypothetical protein
MRRRRGLLMASAADNILFEATFDGTDGTLITPSFPVEVGSIASIVAGAPIVTSNAFAAGAAGAGRNHIVSLTETAVDFDVDINFRGATTTANSAALVDFRRKDGNNKLFCQIKYSGPTVRGIEVSKIIGGSYTQLINDDFAQANIDYQVCIIVNGNDLHYERGAFTADVDISETNDPDYKNFLLYALYDAAIIDKLRRINYLKIEEV